ncbi:hypothetical protein WR25_01231 [Diploscapter pachys]|uniref:Uncharacterized protein n=1 Tax=Diploscapter pachys TaxID=2018661 RepID=A0A2A2M5B4_9BILA|nr:hypothetical protein WR25_01231 [Diploscapter pachys]
MIAMVDQGDLAEGAETHLEHIADIVGLTQEHTLLAVAGHHKAVQLHGWDRRRHLGQRIGQHFALVEQGQVERVGQKLALGVAHAHAVDPGTGFAATVRVGQLATPVVPVPAKRQSRKPPL